MSTFTALTDAELDGMVGRAHREASRCWAEARAATGDLRVMLTANAVEAEAFWSSLVTEQADRQAQVIEDQPEPGTWASSPEGIPVYRPA